MKENTHNAIVVVEPEFGIVSYRIDCSWAANDPSRPCWPLNMSGTPYDQADGENQGCVYQDWVENTECLTGPEVALRFELGEASWEGDCFQFTLGKLVGLDEETP